MARLETLSEGSLDVKGDQDARWGRFGKVLDGLDHVVGSILASHSVLERARSAISDGFLAAMNALRASRRKNDIIRSGRCSACGFISERCDLAGAWVLLCSVREGGSGNVCNDQGEEVSVSRLGAEIVPVFRTHSQRARFTEAWHVLQSEGVELSDLEGEDT